MAAKRAPLRLDDSESHQYSVGSPDRLFSQSSSLMGRITELEKRNVRSKDVSPVASPERGGQDVLKQALQESIASREYLQQKVKLFQEALTQETQRNERIEHENDKLVRENAKLREELSVSFAELQETISQKAHLEARNIELSRQAAKSTPERRVERQSDTLDLLASLNASEEAEILRYLNFVVETVDSVQDLRVLFRGRVHSGSELREAMSNGNGALLILRLLQILSDFIVYYADKHRDITAKQSQCTQTTADRSIVTENLHQHSPSVSSNALDSGSKTLFRLKQTANTAEGPLSPRFKSSGDEYTRLYEEHRNLLTSLNSQSDRLSKLNCQLSATMSSSRRLLATRSLLSANISRVRDKSESLPPADPPEQQVAPTSLTPQAQTATKQSPTHPVAPAAEPPATESGKTASRSPPRKSKFPIYRAKPAVGRRAAVTRPDREVRVFPTLKEDGWSSVSEFFNSAGQEKKKSEGSDSDADT